MNRKNIYGMPSVMDDDQLLFRARMLRGLRALTDLHQDAAASAAGLPPNSLLHAEKGRRCSDATWAAMLAVYASRGLSLAIAAEGPVQVVIAIAR